MSKSKTSSNQAAPPGSSAKAVKPGILIVISAPSGCGKTTLVDRLLKRNHDWIRSVSATTRPARGEEKDGEDYFFVSPQLFAQMEADGGLLESAIVFEKYAYGTPKKFVEDQLAQGKKVILAIDVQGTRKIKKTAEPRISLLTIFILPPSIKVLRDRLEGRKTETPEEIQRRIEKAQDEIKEAGWYDLTFVNQNLEETIAQVEEGIENFEKGLVKHAQS